MKDNIKLDSLYCEIFHQKYMYNIITDRRNKPTYGSLESASELLFLNHIRHLIIKRTCSFYIKAEFEKHCLGEGNQENQNNLEVILDSIVFFPKHKLHIPYITCITGKGLQFTLISQDCYQNVILKRSEAGIISLCVLSIYGIGVGGLKFFLFQIRFDHTNSVAITFTLSKMLELQFRQQIITCEISTKSHQRVINRSLFQNFCDDFLAI